MLTVWDGKGWDVWMCGCVDGVVDTVGVENHTHPLRRIVDDNR